MVRRLHFALSAIALVLASGSSWGVTVGELLPDFTVTNPGQLVAEGNGDGFDYQPFDTQSLRGQVVSLQLVAGRRGIDARNAHYVEALRAADLGGSNFRAVTIVDKGQAIIGTGGFVRGKVEDKQREFPASTFVLDDDSLARKTWGVEKKGYAVVVIDAAGHVLAFHDGVLSAEQVDAFVQTIRDAVQDE